jgi:eukaryotic-like serine/threonine-protein kinase
VSSVAVTSTVETLIGGRWRVQGLLGRGGFADVFFAVDCSPVGLGEAAVKVVRPDSVVGDQEAFLLEARTLAALRHPNLVGYLDSGLDEMAATGGGLIVRPFLVTERCDQTLTEHLSRCPSGILGESDTLQVLAEVTAGLAYLHSRGFIHRDITPGNVLGVDGGWKLADFGLTRPVGPGDVGRDLSVLIGTPGYVAPELLLGADASPAADIFAVGALARRCCTGSPWLADERPTVDPDIWTSPLADVTVRLGRLIGRCTDPDPGRRPTALELLDLIQSSRRPGPSEGAKAARGIVFDRGWPRWLAQIGIPAAVLSVIAGWSVLSLIAPVDSALVAVSGDGGRRALSAPASSFGAAGPEIDARSRLVLDGVTQLAAPPPVPTPGQVMEAVSHLVSTPCNADQPPPRSVEVTNRAEVTVDYHLRVELFGDDGERLGPSSDEVEQVPPGGSAVLDITYPDDDDPPDRCELTAFDATPSIPTKAA